MNIDVEIGEENGKILHRVPFLGPPFPLFSYEIFTLVLELSPTFDVKVEHT